MAYGFDDGDVSEHLICKGNEEVNEDGTPLPSDPLDQIYDEMIDELEDEEDAEGDEFFPPYAGEDDDSNY